MLFALSTQASPLFAAQHVFPHAVLPCGQGEQAQSWGLQREFPVQVQLCDPLVKRHLGSEQFVSARSGPGFIMYNDVAISTPMSHMSL